MREIADEFHVSLDAVVYFMRRNGLPRRGFKETNKINFSKKSLSFSLPKKLSNDELMLKILGTVLYWGEGYKTEKSAGVDFANSDPRMVAVFINFLRKIYNIDEKRLRGYIYCYSNQKYFEIIKFWSKITKIPTNQFTKPYIRKDFLSSKAEKMTYGLVHVRYADKKLLNIIRDDIEKLKNRYA